MDNLNIELELSSITDKIQALAIEVRNANKENNKTNEYDINKILRTAKQYSITEHPLSKSDEHIKKLYITVLSSVMQYDGKPIEDRLIFLSRIMQGCNIDINLMDVIRDGMNIDNDLYDEFIAQINKANLQYNFVVDALIISYCDSKIESKSIEYIAEIASTLSISNDNMKILCNIASIILMQNQKIFKKNFDFIKPKLHYFICYTKEFVDGLLCDNEEVFCFRGKKLIDFYKEDIVDSRKVEITNANVHLKGEELKLKDNESIFINKCNFILEKMIIEKEKTSFSLFGADRRVEQDEYLLIESSSNINISDIVFEMVGKEIEPEYNILKIKACGNINLENIKFNDVHMYSSEKTSSYIFFENIEDLNISNLYTNNCEVKCGNQYDLLGGIVYVENTKKACITDSKFIDTSLRRYNGSSYDTNGNKQGLIYGIQDIQNCESINSANLIAEERKPSRLFGRRY